MRIIPISAFAQSETVIPSQYRASEWSLVPVQDCKSSSQSFHEQPHDPTSNLLHHRHGACCR